MKKFLVFLSFAFVLNLYSLQNDAEQFQLRDMKGQWHVKTSGYYELFDQCMKDFDKLKESSDGMVLFLFGMKVELSDEKFTYGFDNDLLLKTFNQPIDEGPSDMHIILSGLWSSDENNMPTKVTVLGKKEDDGEKKEMNCEVTYPNLNQFHLNCGREEEASGEGHGFTLTRLDSGEVQFRLDGTELDKDMMILVSLGK